MGSCESAVPNTTRNGLADVRNQRGVNPEAGRRSASANAKGE